MKFVFPAAVDGNLLKLVHLSNGFRLADGAKPLAIDYVCKGDILRDLLQGPITSLQILRV